MEITFEESLEKVHLSLLKSVKERFESIPEIVFKEKTSSCEEEAKFIETGSEVGILFSGGIDSTLLAALVWETCGNQEKEDGPLVSSIDLLTVWFSRNSSDLLTSILSYYQLTQEFPGIKMNLIIIE